MEQKKTRCKFCLNSATITEWEPPIGINPYLREFQCTSGHTFYTTITHYKDWKLNTPVSLSTLPTPLPPSTNHRRSGSHGRFIFTTE